MGRPVRGGYQSSDRPAWDLRPPPGAPAPSGAKQARRILANRACESCGGAMANRQSRQRNEKGQLVCDSCKANPQPEWTTTHGSLSVLDQSEMRRREAEAITSIVRIRQAKHTGRSVLAHDSGDQAVIHHCPFCGSGAVVGNSDGSAACDFCHSSFTVQVQPAHPFMPQTIDGESVVPPGMPGGEETELSAPSDPAVEEEGEDVAADPLGDADPNPPSHPNGPDGKPPAGKAEKPFPPKKPADKKPSGGGSQPPWLKNKSSKVANDNVACPVCGGEASIEGNRLKHRWNDSQNHDEHGTNPDQHGPYGYRLLKEKQATFAPYMCEDCGNYRTREECTTCAFRAENKGHRTGPTFVDYLMHGLFPSGASASYRTADGRTLDTEAYMARLALENADDRDAVLDQVRMANTQREATLLDCPTCQGTGEVEDKVNEREPSLTTYQRCPKCKGEGMLDINDPEHFELREPPHEAAMR